MRKVMREAMRRVGPPDGLFVVPAFELLCIIVVSISLCYAGFFFISSLGSFEENPFSTLFLLFASLFFLAVLLAYFVRLVLLIIVWFAHLFLAVWNVVSASAEQNKWQPDKNLLFLRKRFIELEFVNDVDTAIEVGKELLIARQISRKEMLAVIACCNVSRKEMRIALARHQKYCELN